MMMDKNAHKNIGSFRDKDAILAVLPDDLALLRSGDIDWMNYCLDSSVSHLNHGAFGGMPSDIFNLELSLRRRAQSNPSTFYDTLCIPLIRESLMEAELFFNGTVILQPNCTSALKNILSIFEEYSAACLAPIYGATRKLLAHKYRGFSDINPGMFCESASEIIEVLEASYFQRPFNVLFADQVASQSGRVLPMTAVVKWCRSKGVISVIDGTQSNTFENDTWPDYYVLSTHKWLCNAKTCCVVRIGEGMKAPEPIGISFGYADPVDRHIWTGMLDYIPHILLAKVLRVYRKHGKEMVRYSSQLLERGLQYVGMPVLPVIDKASGIHRTMAMIPVRRTEEDLQSAMEKFGIFASVKNLPNVAGTESTTYLRVSSWCYNTLSDFMRLGNYLNYNMRIDDCLGDTPAQKSQRMKIQIMEALEAQMNMEEALYGQLSSRSFFQRAEPLRHPLIFYYGHTAVFFINKLVLGMYLAQEDRIDPDLESLCAVGVDEMSWDDLNVGQWDKVPLEAQASTLLRVKKYRKSVLELLRRLILDPVRELVLPLPQDSIWWVFLMGTEHSRIHFETSSVIIAQLPTSEFVTPSPLWDVYPSSRSTAPNTLVTVAGGTVKAARSPLTTELFGWDNEFGNGKEVTLVEFEVSETLVTNAEYAAFVAEGGYKTPSFWSQEGWKWAQVRSRPLFWVDCNAPGDGDSDEAMNVKFRSMREVIDMPQDWPVVVNNFEAEAFCAWKSTKLGRTVRMISHPEWLLLSKRATYPDYNINFRHGGGPCGVREHGEPLGKKGEIVYDIRGNLWQHSRSLLTVPPEFQVHPLYDDFTLPTIDGHHNFILGGSWASLGNCATTDARYGFRRHFYQFAGIRYVCSTNEDLDRPARLITGEVALRLDEDYMDFTDPVAISVEPRPNGMETFGQIASTFIPSGSSVIVLNGSVGRVTAEIVSRARPQSVLHTDPTANTLDAFLYFIDNQSVRFERTIEGRICRTECAEMKHEWSAGFASTELSVKQLDMFRMSEASVTAHDVAVANLTQLSCLNCPRRGEIPSNMHLLVKPGGILIVLRPFAENRSDNEALRIDGFVDIGVTEVIPHIVRETRRKHRFSESQCSVFRRTEDDVIVRTPTKASQDVIKSQYEQFDVIRSYEIFHYMLDSIYGVQNFPEMCAQFCIDACKKYDVPLTVAMDAGCGPGRLGETK